MKTLMIIGLNLGMMGGLYAQVSGGNFIGEGGMRTAKGRYPISTTYQMRAFTTLTQTTNGTKTNVFYVKTPIVKYNN